MGGQGAIAAHTRNPNLHRVTQRRLSEESDIDIRRCKSQMKREKMYDGSNERQQDSPKEPEENSLWLKHHEDGGF